MASERCRRLASRAKEISQPGEHPRLALTGLVLPWRWWISGNTDTVRLGGCRPNVLPRADRMVSMGTENVRVLGIENVRV